ncbi:MAG: glycerophosphodiester phosphodiesterase [Beutenbergiaceae bacterium]
MTVDDQGRARFLDEPPLAIAHRGGIGLPSNAGIENSVEAFRHAVELGIDYLETDVRASSDGEVFAFHDPDLRRVSARSGHSSAKFSSLSAAQVREAGLDGGAAIPTVAELLAAFPDTRFNIDVKTTPAIAPTIRAIVGAAAQHRVLIASFSVLRSWRARRMLPSVATSANPLEVIGLALGFRPLRGIARRNGVVAVQVPEFYRGYRLITPRFLKTAHAEGLQVHIWTVDDPDDMNRLLDMGVDGIITDRPDLLKKVLIERGQWRDGDR